MLRYSLYDTLLTRSTQLTARCSAVDPYTESGQNLYRQYAGRKNKIVLNATWVVRCIHDKTLHGFATNWAGCKVTGKEQCVHPLTPDAQCYLLVSKGCSSSYCYSCSGASYADCATTGWAFRSCATSLCLSTRLRAYRSNTSTIPGTPSIDTCHFCSAHSNSTWQCSVHTNSCCGSTSGSSTCSDRAWPSHAYS